MKPLFNFLLLLVILFALFYTELYSQIFVNIKQPPQNRLMVDDLWQIQITNLSGKASDIFLIGKLSMVNIPIDDALWWFEATTNIFTLEPGITRINLQMISPVKIDYSDKKYYDIILKTGSVPEGEYDYCVQVMERNTNQELASGCLPQLQIVRNVWPPQLISPANGQIVEVEYPLFSVILQNDLWLFDRPSRPESKNENKIVEIIGTQSPLDAIKSNPAFFTFTTDQLSFVYPTWARKFEQGKHYAWQVKILDKYNNKISESEISVFTFMGTDALKSSDGPNTSNPEGDLIDITNQIDNSNNYLAFNKWGFDYVPMNKTNLISNNINENQIPIKFSGNSKFYAQTSDRQGTNSQIPKNFWRWDINSTLSFYDIPIGFSAYVSSEQKDIRQNINMFQLQFSPQQLLNKGITASEGTFVGDFLSLFSNIGIGTCYPRYSSLAMNGIAVSGVDIEFTPGIFYLAFTYGRSQKAIEGTNILPTYQRNIIFTKIGLGNKQTTHFYLTASKSWDEANSVKKDTALIKPQENHLVGAEAKLTLFDQAFSIEGEIIASVLTRDTKAADIETDFVPEWIRNIIKPKISTSVDYAYSVNANIILPTKTKFGAVYKYLGPGFSTHGVPFLKNDLISYEFKAEQDLLNRNITAKFYYKNNYDNLIPWKRYRTTITSYGINLGLRFRDIPYLQINYSPFFHENDSKITSNKFDNNTKLISVMTGYNYPIGKINFSSNIYMSYQQNKSLNEFYNYIVRNYSFNQTVGFTIPLFISATASIMQSDYYFSKSKIYSYDFSGSYTAFESWTSAIGFNYTSTKDYNNKTGFYFTTSFPVANLLDVELFVENNFYNDLLINPMDFNETILKLTITKHW